MKRRWNIVRRQLQPRSGLPFRGMMGQWTHSVSNPLTEQELRCLIRNGWGALDITYSVHEGIRIITCHTGETGYVTMTEFFIQPLSA